MKEIEVEIRNEAGLHARPSSLFVQIAGEYDANVTVVSEGEEVNGKSIMGLMLLAADDYHPLIQIEAIKNLRQMRSNAALEKLRELSLSNSNLNVS